MERAQLVEGAQIRGTLRGVVGHEGAVELVLEVDEVEGVGLLEEGVDVGGRRAGMDRVLETFEGVPEGDAAEREAGQCAGEAEHLGEGVGFDLALREDEGFEVGEEALRDGEEGRRGLLAVVVGVLHGQGSEFGGGEERGHPVDVPVALVPLVVVVGQIPRFHLVEIGLRVGGGVADEGL